MDVEKLRESTKLIELMTERKDNHEAKAFAGFEWSASSVLIGKIFICVLNRGYFWTAEGNGQQS